MKEQKSKTMQALLAAARLEQVWPKAKRIRLQDYLCDIADCHETALREQRRRHAAELQAVQGASQRRIDALQAQLAGEQRKSRTARQLAEALRAELDAKAGAAAVAKQQELISARNEAMRLRAKYEEEKEARQAAEAMLQQLLADMDEKAQQQKRVHPGAGVQHETITFPLRPTAKNAGGRC